MALPAFAQNCPDTREEVQKRQEAECRARGDEWGRFGVYAHLCNFYSCVPRTKDGGKACENHSDCEYRCISEKPLPLGSEAKGTCAKIASPFGCTYHVNGGRIAGRICMD